MPSRPVSVSPIAAFTDNYIWALHDDRHAAVVDPGDAAPVLAWLQRTGLRLTAILLTHHHPDHVGGVTTLASAWPAVPVFGHALDAHRLPPLTTALREGDAVEVPGLDLRLEVIASPGHTLGHLCYTGDGLLFSGDTLFSAGCGRMFEGTPPMFQHTLARLAALPEDTQVFVGHEYTVANLCFAASLMPDDEMLAAALAAARAKRAAGHCTLPSTIAWERRHNPFLRCEEPAMAAAAGVPGAGPVEVFAALRRAKDGFRAA